MPVWQHGADPVAMLQIDQLVAGFRQKLDENPNFLKDKCQEYFKVRVFSVLFQQVSSSYVDLRVVVSVYFACLLFTVQTTTINNVNITQYFEHLCVGADFVCEVEQNLISEFGSLGVYLSAAT